MTGLRDQVARSLDPLLTVEGVRPPSRSAYDDADIALDVVAEWLRSEEAFLVANSCEWDSTEEILAALADLISPPRPADTGTAGDAVEPAPAPAPVAGPTPPGGPATT